jgi:hypothetical protein
MRSSGKGVGVHVMEGVGVHVMKGVGVHVMKVVGVHVMKACEGVEVFFFSRFDTPQWARASSLSRLHDHRHKILGRTPPDE